jgi:hypothetical protein
MTSGLVHAAWSGEATAFDADADGRPISTWRPCRGTTSSGATPAVALRTAQPPGVPATPWGAMGTSVLDWNGDGRFDLFVTDMHTDMSSPLQPEDERKKHDPKTFFPPDFLGHGQEHVLGNALFTNKGSLSFAEESDAAGAETGWPWGPSVGDLNADGWPDSSWPPA